MGDVPVSATDLEQRAHFYEQDAAAAWEKCEERRLRCEALLAALKAIAANAGANSSVGRIARAAISKAEGKP